MSTQHRSFAAVTRAVEIDGETRTRTEVIASTSAPGRDGDVWAQDWRLDNYRANPVVLDSHASYGTHAVVGRALEVGVVEHPEHGPALRALIEWDDHPGNPEGQRIAGLFRRGMLSAVSVGMRPGTITARAALPGDHPAHGPSGSYMQANELLEISAVAIPADPRAVAQRAEGGLGAMIRAEVLRLIRGDDEVRRALAALPLSHPEADSGHGLDWLDELPERLDDLAELFTYDSHGSTP